MTMTMTQYGGYIHNEQCTTRLHQHIYIVTNWSQCPRRRRIVWLYSENASFRDCI